MSVTKTKKVKLRLTMPNNCWYCGAIDPSTIDHVQPIAKGGTDDLDNLVLACKCCNSSKRALNVEEFKFQCSWKKTKYSKVINSTDAFRLTKQGVKFDDFINDHTFWFEALI